MFGPDPYALEEERKLLLEIVVVPDKIIDVGTVPRTLGKESSRWGRLDILNAIELNRLTYRILTSPQDLSILLSFPLPNVN